MPTSIFFIELILQLDVYWFGIKPRQYVGVLGILTSPLKHGDLPHLLGNTLLLLPLLVGTFYQYGKKAFLILIQISLLGNTFLWLFARGSWHYGASGIVYGIFFFLITVSIRFKKKELFIYPLIVLFLSSGFWIGLLPVQPGVSFEGHLFGALAGIVTAIFIKNPKKNTNSSALSPNSTIKIEYNYIYKEKDTD